MAVTDSLTKVRYRAARAANSKNENEKVNHDASHKVTCALRQRYTKQRITGCTWVGHEQSGHPCESSFDDTLGGGGWAFDSARAEAEIMISIEPATVAYIELLFHHSNEHIWEEFEIHIIYDDGGVDRDMDMTLNMANDANVVKPCGPRFRIVRDQEGNPKKHAEYKVGFVYGPVHRVKEIFFKVHDTFHDAGNAVLTEVYVYGTKTGQFASTTKDHEGRYLMATQDNLLMAVDSVTSSPAAQFEMEPLTGGQFAWRNINKLYMVCNPDGTLKFSKKTSDESGVKITIEEQQPDSVVVDPAKQPSGDETNIASDPLIRTIPQTDYLKSCYPGFPGKCSAKRKVGWAIRDHNEGGCYTNTWEKCLELCCQDPKCKSFDYNTDNSGCCISHRTMEGVAQGKRWKNAPKKWSYSKISITPSPPKAPKGKKRVAFRTEMGGYLTVDQDGQFMCNSIILQENAIFDLIRPIETGHINIFF